MISARQYLSDRSRIGQRATIDSLSFLRAPNIIDSRHRGMFQTMLKTQVPKLYLVYVVSRYDIRPRPISKQFRFTVHYSEPNNRR